MERKDLLKDKTFILTKFQIELFNQITEYLIDNDLSRSQFADQLGVSKGYISQILNGEFDHKLSKLIELYLSIGKIPKITTTPMDQNIESTSTTFIAKVIPLSSGYFVESVVDPKVSTA